MKNKNEFAENIDLDNSNVIPQKDYSLQSPEKNYLFRLIEKENNNYSIPKKIDSKRTINNERKIKCSIINYF